MKVKYHSTDKENVNCTDKIKVSRLKLEDYSCKFLNIEIDTKQIAGKDKNKFHTEVIIPIRGKKDLKNLIKKLQKMESKF